MSSNLAVLALLIALLAGGAAGYALMQERSGPSDLDARLQALEVQMARIEAAVAEQDHEPQPPRLEGVATPTRRTWSPSGDRNLTGMEPEQSTEAAGLAEGASEEAIRELIDEAVDHKAAQFRAMANKKPSIDLFSNTLELTEAQREDAEREIVQSQEQIKSILEIPTEDGTYFMNDLVETFARSMADPEEAKPRWTKLFGRLMTEKIPGSDDTYATRIEGVKQSLRETFKRAWTPEQFTTFHAWEMDPTEVQDVPGSPWKEIEARVFDRARDLGAEIPEDR